MPALVLEPRPGLLDEAQVATLFALLPEARIVGGAVRDLLAGRSVADIDFASPLPVESVAQRLREAGVKVVPTGLSHGTVTAVLDGRGFEITTLRRDVATDGRHAVVAFDAGWREDALRRDFTINQLSMDEAGRVFDYAGGIEDLRAGVLRFVGEPMRRIEEDYLRALRFFRFHARYARREPDAATREALAAAAPVLARADGPVAPERAWQELKRILGVPDPVASLGLMREVSVLEAVLPEAGDLEALARLVEAERGSVAALTTRPMATLLRLACLVGHEAVEGLALRLRLAAHERDALLALLEPRAPLLPGAGDGAIRAVLASAPRVPNPRRWALARSLLAEAFARPGRDEVFARLGRDEVFARPGRDEVFARPGRDEVFARPGRDKVFARPGRDEARDDIAPHEAWEALRERINLVSFREFPLRGQAVLRAGAAPGPAVGRILAELRDEWLAAGAPEGDEADRALEASLRDRVALLPPGERRG